MNCSTYTALDWREMAMGPGAVMRVAAVPVDPRLRGRRQPEGEIVVIDGTMYVVRRIYRDPRPDVIRLMVEPWPRRPGLPDAG